MDVMEEATETIIAELIKSGADFIKRQSVDKDHKSEFTFDFIENKDGMEGNPYPIYYVEIFNLSENPFILSGYGIYDGPEKCLMAKNFRNDKKIIRPYEPFRDPVTFDKFESVLVKKCREHRYSQATIYLKGVDREISGTIDMGLVTKRLNRPATNLQN